MELFEFADLSDRLPEIAGFDDDTTDDEIRELVEKLRPHLRNVIGVTIGKGGQGKTTLSSNIAYMLAEEQEKRARNGKSAKPVLYAELDANGNGRREYGLQGGEFDDSGARFVQSIVADGPFTVVKNVRPYLDTTIGGPKIGDLNRHVNRLHSAHGKSAFLLLALLLAQISHHYRWIVLDFSPGDKEIQKLGLATTTHLVAPIMDDDNGTLDGLSALARLIRMINKLLNPEAALAAIAFLGFPKVHDKQTSKLELVREKILNQLSKANMDPDLMLSEHIRRAEGLATQCRNQGRPAREMARAATGTLVHHETEQQVPRPRDEKGRLIDPEMAVKLAGDYGTVAVQMIARVRARNNELKAAENQRQASKMEEASA
ncbi:ParA family protein [Streptomyces sp. NPDC000594]|uniref:ParA family protein n=1 Tax=unclassified Streptomyces TaxID=2593676 RepID=UPI00331F7363